MKNIRIVMLALVSMSLSGCYTHSSAEGVIGSAYKALTKNDVKKFPKFLTGEAKQKYSSLKGMAELQEQLSAYKQVEIAEVNLVDTVTDTHGDDVRRNYTAVIMGSDGAVFASIMTAYVTCEVRYTYTTESHGPGYYGPGYGGGYYGPYPPVYNPSIVSESEYCLISKLD